MRCPAFLSLFSLSCRKTSVKQTNMIDSLTHSSFGIHVCFEGHLIITTANGTLEWSIHWVIYFL